MLLLPLLQLPRTLHQGEVKLLNKLPVGIPLPDCVGYLILQLPSGGFGNAK